jgi:hypothetical protein
MKAKFKGPVYYYSVVLAAKNYLAQRWNLNILLMLLSIGLSAQTAGSLKVTITDQKTKEPIPFAGVIVYSGTTTIATGTSDIEGVCLIKPLEAGKYNVKAAYVGYEILQINDVVIQPGKVTYLSFVLSIEGVDLKEITVTDYKVPLIDPDTKTGGTTTTERYESMATKSISSVVSTSAGVYSSDEGGTVYVRGSRSSTTTVFIDGERVIGATSIPSSSTPEPKKVEVIKSVESGILTAGEINDFKKWDLWKEIGKEGLGQYSKTWNMEPDERYSVFVMYETKKPVIDAAVTLHAKDGKLLWSSKTDNAGRTELWVNMFEKNEIASYIEVELTGKKFKKEDIKKFRKGINIIEIPGNNPVPENLDLMFVVDATGSMGDEINYLKEELNNIIMSANQQLPCIKINLGSVFYRDWKDDYLTKASPLSPDINATLDFIKEQSANGGGDFPEAVDKALEAAISNTKWSKNAAARLLFLVLDAPPHDSDRVKKELQKQIAKAAELGIRIIPLAASGVDKSTEYLMRSMALATNGTYVFLTDHSGVGDSHIKPSTNEYDVEYLNKLMVRLIKQYAKTPSCNPDAGQQTNASDTTRVIIAHEVLVKSKRAKNKIEENKKDSVTVKDSMQTNKITAKDNRSEKSFKFYPNPTKGKITIEEVGDLGELFLSDINGKLMERYEIKRNESTEVDISAYPEGTYMLQYKSEGKWYNGKVVLIGN